MMDRPLRRKDSLLPGYASLRVARELVPELDEHVAAHAVLFHQYLKHTWVSEQAAPAYSALADLHRADVFTRLGVVGRATSALGGVPLGSPLEHVNRSYLEHEGEGVYSLEAMSKRSLSFEGTLILRLTVTVEAAAELTAVATRQMLQGLAGAAKLRRARLARFIEEEVG